MRDHVCLLRVIIYIFWQVTQGRKQLIGQLRQQIVNVSVIPKNASICTFVLYLCGVPSFLIWNSIFHSQFQLSLLFCFLSSCHQEGKDKSFLLEKLQNLQKSNPKKPKQKNQKKVCCWKYLMLTQLNINFYPESCHQPHCKCPLALQQNSWSSDDHPSGGQSNSNAMVQALLARQRLEEVEEEEERHSGDGVPVPSDTSTSSALLQAMLARQRAQDQDEDLHRMHDTHSSSSSALAQAMQARQMSQIQERDEYFSTGGLSDGTPSALAQAMQARQRADEYGDADGLPSPVSSVMMQVMQARQRAEEAPQNPAPAGSSALIQAMLARQQAQNEYDDGYWTLS